MTNDRETENRGEPFENDAKSDFAAIKRKSEIKLTSDTEKDCALRRRR